MRHAGRITTGLLALAIICQAGFADEKTQNEKVDRKALDTALYNTLRDVINKGADMYNNGDMTGCYRLFEGALLTAKPMLDHRPELQKSIAKAMASADGDAVTYRRAFALRAALDKVRAELNPNPKKDEKIPPPKLDGKKAEDMKLEEKKAEDKKAEDKKAADKKAEDEKSGLEDKKLIEKKSDPKDKKPDDKKDDKKEKLPPPKSDPDDDR